MQVLLDPSNIESAVQLVTKVDGHKVSLQVIICTHKSMTTRLKSILAQATL